MDAGGIEMAIPRVVQKDVGFDAAILADALRKRRFANYWELARRNVTRRIVENRLLGPGGRYK